MRQTRVFDNSVVERDTSLFQHIRPSHAVSTAGCGPVDKGRPDTDGVWCGFPCRVVFGDGSQEEDDGEAAVEFEVFEFDVGGPVPQAAVQSVIGYDGTGDLACRVCCRCDSSEADNGNLGKRRRCGHWGLCLFFLDHNLSGN